MQLSARWSHHLSGARRVRPSPPRASSDLLTSQRQWEQTVEFNFQESLLLEAVEEQECCHHAMQYNLSNLLRVALMLN